MLCALILLTAAQTAIPPADNLSQVPTATTDNTALLQEQISTLQTELAATRQQRDNARGQLESRDAQINNLQSALANSRQELKTARANARSSTANNKDMTSTLANLQTQVTTLEADLASAKTKQATLQNNLQQTLSALAATQQQLRAAQTNSVSRNEALTAIAIVIVCLLITFLLGIIWQKRRVRNRLGGLEL